jgi:ATP-dependent DNA ligase
MADDSNMERRHIDTMWKQKDIQAFYSIRTFLLKLDGYRALAIKTDGKVQIRSRNDNDFALRYPAIAKALASLLDETVVVGEIVALDEGGKPSFNTLQNYGSSGAPLHYYIFDLLVLAGKDVVSETLDARRTLLEKRVCRSSKSQYATRLCSTVS